MVQQYLNSRKAEIYPSLCNDSEGGNPLAEELIKNGHVGAAAGKGIFDYSNISQTEYMEKRMKNIIKMQEYIKENLKEK